MASESDFLFGLKFNFDPTGFLRGSAEAQDQLERTVAAIISAKDKTESEVTALAAALSRSPEQVRAALKDLATAERNHEREMERTRIATERRQAEQQRTELAQIRTRTQAVSQLRDALLSVAAITVGGAGLAGINSLLQATSTRGVEEQSFAQRTGTNTRQNIAEEEGAYLSGMSSREEARQSISAYANAQSQYRLTGESGLSTSLLRAGVSITPDQMLNMSHERFVSYVVGQLRGLGYNDQLTSTILEQSGLTSGGYTNLALHPEQMRRFNQQGEARANEISSNTQRDLEFQQSWRNMVQHLETVRDDISHDLEPWVKQLDGFLVEFDRFSKEHPDKAREIEETVAAVVALGGLFSAITLAIVPMMGAIRALRAAATVAGVVTTSPVAMLAGAAAVTGAILYKDYRDIRHDLSDPGRIENNRLAMKDRFYGSGRYGALEQSQREYQILDHLIRERGYSPEEAASVAAQARAESGFNERAIGDNGTAEGAFQWHSDRRKAIEAHFKKRISQMSLIEQVDAFDWELRNGEKAAGGKLFSSRNLNQAVAAGLDAERPKDYLEHGTAGMDYSRRYKMALAALQQTRGIVSQAPVSAASGGNTTMHIQHLNVKADNAQQLVGSLRQAAGLPNAHAVAANTGVH